MAFFLIGLVAALPAGAAKGSYPRSYHPETAAGFTNTFSTNGVLSPACPQALAATPGSDPASKVLNGALNTPASFAPGGTVHYRYLDNPHTNGGTQNFTIQDCVVTYPAGFFKAGDFDSSTGVLTNAAYTKQTLSKGGTQIDGASLSGISSSVGEIYYSWTAPPASALTVGTWVCNFARDIKNNHGGGGNRKVPPTCYQVPPDTPVPADVFLGYADQAHTGGSVPSPWQGDPGVVFLGCTNGSPECGNIDAGAIRVDNTGLAPLTLANAYVDIGPCKYQPWGALLPATAGGGGKLILTQTGTLGPPAPGPCNASILPPDRPYINFDTSEGETESCTVQAPVPVITLVFSGGATLTVRDVDRVLNTGGFDRNHCQFTVETTPWTAVLPANITRTP